MKSNKPMKDIARIAMDVASRIQNDIYEISKPPAEGKRPRTHHVVDFTLVKGTRGYLGRIVNQINGSYEYGWYDASAVMLRRLIETLIIECFEHHGIAANIKTGSGDYMHLKDLIGKTLSETAWSLGRNAKQALPKLKDIGDQSAHSRRFNANRDDIEKILPEIRTVVQELLYLAGLK